MDAIHDFGRELMIVRERRETGATKHWVFRQDRVPTPLGDLIVLTDGEGKLRAAEFWDYETRMWRLLRRHYGGNVTLHSGAAPADTRARLREYFAGELGAIDAIEVKTAGTTFQRAVWDATRRIPLGQMLTYRQLASAVGRPKAVRAVGHANSGNPVCVVVPCHRVVGSKNVFVGYAGGLARKHWLLIHEGALPPDTPPPDEPG